MPKKKGKDNKCSKKQEKKMAEKIIEDKTFGLKKKKKSTSKKRRSKSKNKDDYELKRPLNCYLLFSQDIREENEKKGGDPITFQELSKKWKKLSSSKKKMYQERYEKNRIEYENEIKS